MIYKIIVSISLFIIISSCNDAKKDSVKEFIENKNDKYLMQDIIYYMTIYDKDSITQFLNSKLDVCLIKDSNNLKLVYYKAALLKSIGEINKSEELISKYDSLIYKNAKQFSFAFLNKKNGNLQGFVNKLKAAKNLFESDLRLNNLDSSQKESLIFDYLIVKNILEGNDSLKKQIYKISGLTKKSEDEISQLVDKLNDKINN
jgi:hypothetical protein